MSEPRVVSLAIYPVKSLDGVSVREAEAMQYGGLRGDRRYAVLDGSGAIINAKREPGLLGVRAVFAADLDSATFWASPEKRAQAITVNLERDSEVLADWLSAQLGYRVTLADNPEGGFPDDLEANGPTLVGEASRRQVAAWFALPEEEVQRRFRVNIEVATSAAFEEDGWLADEAHGGVLLQVGRAVLQLRRACQRCTVPTRDSKNARVDPGFARRFQQLRMELPVEAHPRYFDHFYRYALNTVVVQSGVIRVGDAVTRLA